jgi:hypothetical protein
MTLFSREFFDTLIIVVVIIGAAFALLRLYRDFTRPLPGDPRYRPPWAEADTDDTSRS